MKLSPALMRPRFKKFRQKISLVLLFLTLFVAFTPRFAPASAGALTEASVRLDRMGASIVSNTTTAKILIVVEPTTAGTEARIKITWPTTNAFTVDSTAANNTFSTASLPATYQTETVVAMPGMGGATGTASAVSGGDVTFLIGDISAGTLYAFWVTGGITNPVTGNAGTHVVTLTTQTSAPATIDTQDTAVDTVTTNADQVTVTATVPATFNFNVQDTALPLGSQALGAVDAEAMSPTIDVDTNGKNGWTAWMRSENTTYAGQELDSSSTGDSISSTNTGSPVTCSAGTDCYVFDVGVVNGTGSGTPAVTTEYDGGANATANGSSTIGGVISTTHEEIAYSGGPGSNDEIQMAVVVAIDGTTQAASDYADIIEVIGAGNF